MENETLAGAVAKEEMPSNANILAHFYMQCVYHIVKVRENI